MWGLGRGARRHIWYLLQETLMALAVAVAEYAECFTTLSKTSPSGAFIWLSFPSVTRRRGD